MKGNNLKVDGLDNGVGWSEDNVGSVGRWFDDGSKRSLGWSEDNLDSGHDQEQMGNVGMSLGE